VTEQSLEESLRETFNLVLREFFDIVVDAQLRFTSSGAVERLRLFLKDKSFVDVWLSSSGNYPCHWEPRALREFLSFIRLKLETHN
jgi:hypothetical protein